MENGDPATTDDAEKLEFLRRAHHEAAHAVVAAHLGWPVTKVEAHPLPADIDWSTDDVEEAKGGGTDLDDEWVAAQLAGPSRELRLRERTQIALAGAVGDAIFTARRPMETLTEPGCLSDWNAFGTDAIALGVPPEQLQAEAARTLQAVEQMVREHNLDSSIRAVAAQLMETHEVSGEELARLIAT